MKKLILLLFLIPNVVMGVTKDIEKYICSSNAEASPMFDANAYKSDVDPSLWNTYPEDTMLMEIDYVRKTITTKSYSGQTQFKDVYELIIPDKKKYYVDSHITGSSINIYDSCANEYSSQDRYNEYVKKNNLKARKHPISDDCKYNKNTPRATVDTILFNLKTTRFIKSWLIEGEETQKRPRGNFGAQITYGLCSREN